MSLCLQERAPWLVSGKTPVHSNCTAAKIETGATAQKQTQFGGAASDQGSLTAWVKLQNALLDE